MWFGGTNVDGYRGKQRRQIARVEPDVLTLQESYGVRARQIGTELGWDFYQAGYSLGIVSRYPIVERLGTVERFGTVAAGVRVRLPDGTEVAIWTAHLAYDPYGPYDACFDAMTPAELLQRERDAGRPQQMRAILDAMADDLAAADDVPVLLTGDFNTPSHLDWVPAAADLHCGYEEVVWPTTRLAAEAGLVDTFRTVHPDPAARPATTWSPIYPRHQGSTGPREPQDRIDFTLLAGDDLVPVRARTYAPGDPRPYGEHEDNRWTSDHAAVITTFDVR